MRVFVLGLALSAVLAAAPTFAQAPAQPAPRPAAPAQTAPRPAPPIAPQPAAPAPNVPFPAGVKYAYVNLEAVFAESAEGKKVQTLIQTRQTELAGLQKSLQDAQAKAQQNASVQSDAAKAQAQADLERQDKDLQRKLEDAQAEVQGAQQAAQADWQKRIMPVVQKLAQEKQLHMLLSVPDSGLVWADPSLDLTQELIKAQGGSPAAATPAPPAARPAAPATGK